MTPQVILRSAAPQELRYDKREAARYLGCRTNTPALDDGGLFRLVASQLQRAVAAKACYAVLPVRITGTRVDFGAFSLDSSDLAKNLAGCNAAILFAATLGAGADRCILTYKKTLPSRAMLLDAVASSMIECWCDDLQAELTAGKESCPRFSPGYGDVPLTVQREILSLLDAQRRLGITLSDTCFMTPTKSVTAFIGLKGEGTA